MVETEDIYWLAGLLEGEGCFGAHTKTKTPRIRLNMTDLDVVERAHKLLGATCKISRVDRSKQNPNWKDTYNFTVPGRRAAGWMMTLYSLMGERRQAKIREVLFEWQDHPVRRLRNFGIPRKLENGSNNAEYNRTQYAARQCDRGLEYTPRTTAKQTSCS